MVYNLNLFSLIKKDKLKYSNHIITNHQTNVAKYLQDIDNIEKELNISSKVLTCFNTVDISNNNGWRNVTPPKRVSLLNKFSSFNLFKLIS